MESVFASVTRNAVFRAKSGGLAECASLKDKTCAGRHFTDNTGIDLDSTVSELYACWTGLHRWCTGKVLSAALTAAGLHYLGKWLSKQFEDDHLPTDYFMLRKYFYVSVYLSVVFNEDLLIERK